MRPIFHHLKNKSFDRVHVDLVSISLSFSCITQTPPPFARTIKHLAGASAPAISANPLLSLLSSSCSNVPALKKIHGSIIVHGLARDLSCQTKLLSCYGSFGDAASARALFERIPDPDFYSSKVMLRWHALNDQYAEAIACFSEMRRRYCEHDNFVFSLVLKACAKLFNLEEGKKLHGLIIKAGNADLFVLNVLIDMYAKCGELGCGRKLFDKIVDRNAVSWSSIISGYVHNDCAEEALLLFNEMRQENSGFSEHIMGSLFVACSVMGALHQGKWIHGCMVKHGITLHSYIGTALLDMYVKCGELAYARSVFDELVNVDVISWTAMIVGYTQKGLPFEALKLFSDGQWVKLIPNSVTIATTLSATAQLRDSKLGSCIHAFGINLGVSDRSLVMNALVDMYSKCGMVMEARYIFESAPEKDLVTWNAMIAGLSQNDLSKEALSLFNRLRLDGILPDAVTVVSALSSCASLGDPLVGSSYHGYAMKFGFITNVYVSTAVLHFYNKCGDAIFANRVFNEMDKRNAVTWCAMMVGHGMQGDCVSSLDLFQNMLNEDLQPNDVTFTSILSTCSHNGMIDEGQKYFNKMFEHYNIVPSMKHYVCMVDMLARAGKLEEALDFIERMPVQADYGVWGAFIHGCRLHSRLELGEVAVKKMMELFPDTSDYYVLISNWYASNGRWNEALNIRKVMKERGLNKLSGCSSVMSE